MKQSDITELLRGRECSDNALLAMASDPQGQDALICYALGERDEQMLRSIAFDPQRVAGRHVSDILSTRLAIPDDEALNHFMGMVADVAYPNAGLLSVAAWASWAFGDDDGALDFASRAKAKAAGSPRLAGAAIALVEAGETPQSAAKGQ